MEILSNQQVIEKTIHLDNDIGFVSIPVKNRKLKIIESISDEILIILNPSHPLAKKRRLRVNDLEGQMIIMHEQGSYFQQMIHDMLDTSNVSVTMPLIFSNNEAIKRAVEGGTGIAPISKKVAAKEIESGKLIALPFSATPIYRTFYMIHHKEKYISQPLKQFIKLIKQ